MVFDVTLKGRPPGDAGCLPGSIHIEVPGRDTDVLITFTEVEPNVDLPTSAWRIVPPAGARVETVLCREAGPEGRAGFIR